jgi:hypothetical protein
MQMHYSLLPGRKSQMVLTMYGSEHLLESNTAADSDTVTCNHYLLLLIIMASSGTSACTLT